MWLVGIGVPEHEGPNCVVLQTAMLMRDVIVLRSRLLKIEILLEGIQP